VTGNFPVTSAGPNIQSSPPRSSDRSRVEIFALLLIAVFLPKTAQAEAPMNYLFTHGVRAQSIAYLAWFTIAVSLLVILIITGLLLAAIRRGRSRLVPVLPGEAFVERPPGGASWIYIGVGITTMVLLVTMVWTFVTLASTGNPPPGPAAVRLQITGHQWWWEVRYLDDDPSQEFTTANELHIPVGKVVQLTLQTADVIHSFWVPALAGKTDLIPGQHNQTWLMASHPGVYRGQCGEYCGQQHAHMAFEVIASAPDQFQQWRKRQLQSTALHTATNAGQDLFIARCGICHTVRGTMAGGVLGPDLTHVATRQMIAAATVQNNPAGIAAWIADPQHIKPGNYMPRLDLSGPQLASLLQYVQSLK
jgi:cytochrome c oxidase subunit 2